jgi:ABC-2 type transport system ATP-binding protein
MELLFSGTNIQKSYPKSNFTLQVDQLSLYSGSITGVVGENGNGKTTLLNVVAGELASTGKLEYLKFNHPKSPNWTRLKDSIAFIPQRIPRWYGTLYQNLCLKAALEKIPADQIDSYLNEILDFLNLHQYKNLTWAEISTGYRLRFELARVLIGKPKILVLDEPIANLDINTQQKFLSDLKNILATKEYPVAAILSSQQLHEIESVADHMVFLRNGKAIFSGNVDQIAEEQQNDILEIQVKDNPRLEEFLHNQDLAYKRRGEYYQIEMDKLKGKNEFLRSLLSQDFEIKYYRDISNSTKRLFSE